MEQKVNYKQKYLDLRSKFISSMDVAFRMGFEQATKEAQVQQAQAQMQQVQQQQQAMMQQQALAQQGQPQGDPSQDPSQGGMVDQSGEQPQGGNDVDNYISQIEGIVNKSENIPEDLKKAIQEMKLAKAKPQFSLSYQHNLPEHQKKVLNKQEEIVASLMKKWDEESKEVANDILKTVKAI